MPDPIVVEHLTLGELACTCTIVADPASGEAIVVDGGAEPERILARLDELGVCATHFVHTHAHVDHIGALGELHARTGAPGLLHPADLPLFATLTELSVGPAICHRLTACEAMRDKASIARGCPPTIASTDDGGPGGLTVRGRQTG